nr:MAG TPA: PcfK-like protein [Caudoviricetes sp.]
MVDVTEQAKQAYRSAIIKYLHERCKTDKYLAEACKKENKSLDGVIKYIIGEARKRKEGNVAVISDAEVYEMAVHYILEDSLDCEEKKSEQSAKKDVATDTNVVANEDDDEALEQRNEDENSVGETYKPAPKAKVKTIAEEAQLGFDF